MDTTAEIGGDISHRYGRTPFQKVGAFIPAPLMLGRSSAVQGSKVQGFWGGRIEERCAWGELCLRAQKNWICLPFNRSTFRNPTIVLALGSSSNTKFSILILVFEEIFESSFKNLFRYFIFTEPFPIDRNMTLPLLHPKFLHFRFLSSISLNSNTGCPNF